LLIDHGLQNHFAGRCVLIAEPMGTHDELPGPLTLKQQLLTQSYHFSSKELQGTGPNVCVAGGKKQETSSRRENSQKA